MGRPFIFSETVKIAWRRSQFKDGVSVKDLGSSDGQAMQLVGFKLPKLAVSGCLSMILSTAPPALLNSRDTRVFTCAHAWPVSRAFRQYFAIIRV
jgi:hypothetical protein